MPQSLSPRAETEITELIHPPLTVESSENHVWMYSYMTSDRCLAALKELRGVDEMLRRERLSRLLPDDFPMTPCWFHLQSDGGEMFPSISLAETIPTIPTPIYSIIEGCVASAASFVALACKRRYMQAGALLLIHQVQTMVGGSFDLFKDEMRALEMLMAWMVSFYTQHSRLDEETVRGMLKRNSYFSASEALEAGLIDAIYEGPNTAVPLA